jgi:hypothetical protein
MPFDTYANLKASILARSKRNDVSSDMLADYINQAEAEFYNNAQAPLRIRAMEARATATVSTSSRFLALPDLFLQMRRLKLNDPFSGSRDTDIEYLAPEQMPLNNLVQYPHYFTVTTQLEFDSTPDAAYTAEMQYIKKLIPLSDSNTTNTILSDHPNIYLFGGLWALFLDMQEGDVSEFFYNKFISAIEGANRTDQAGRYGPAPIIRAEGYHP